MEPIHVPAPPKQAFNKNRRISDLIRAQVKHLKHVEASMPAKLRDTVPQHPITTESDAANYIAAMTNLFQSQAMTLTAADNPATSAPSVTPTTPVPIKTAPPVSPAPPLAIAASADILRKKSKQKKDKQKKQKSPAKDKKRKKK